MVGGQAAAAPCSIGAPGPRQAPPGSGQPGTQAGPAFAGPSRASPCPSSAAASSSCPPPRIRPPSRPWSAGGAFRGMLDRDREGVNRGIAENACRTSLKVGSGLLRIVPVVDHGAMRVLLVEDDATIAEFVRKGLREAGFAVDHARDGEEGL